MNDNQILVVHSRRVYNFMGIILEARVSYFFFFSLLCILFKNLFQILKPYVLEKTAIEKALHANECEEMNRPFIANLGHPLWGSQSMQELAPGMRNVLPFLIRDAKSCIDCESASPIKDDPDLQWMLLLISYTCTLMCM